MYTLFKLVRLISVKDDVNPVYIKSYAWRQHGESSLLALACTNGFIVLWYRGSGQQPVVKQLPWPPDHPITSMCFDPTVSWLLVQTDNGNIFIIPALAMVDAESQVNQLWRLDDVTIISSLKPRGTPTVTIWWHTLDGQQIAIVATRLGEILFVNLLSQQVVAETSVDVHITNMELAQDDQQTSTQLLITGKSGQQWKMLLEKRSAKVQPTDNEITDMGYESIDGMNLPIRSLLIKPNPESTNEDLFYPEDISKFSRSVTLSPQYAKGRHFVTAHCDKTSTYQVYDSSMEHNPMFVYCLPLGSLSVILTDRILFATSKLGGDQKLLVLSNQRAETSEDHQQAFNKDAILQQFELPPEDRLLTILPKSFPFYWHEKLEEQLGKLSHDQDDRRSTGSESETGYDQSKAPSAFEIPLSSHTVLDGCIVISDSTVYECRPRISPERLFLELCSSQSDAGLAEQLGISLSLDLNFLFEEAADFLLSHGNSKQAARLFHMSKGSAVRRVSSFAKYGYIHEILPYLQQLLTKSSTLNQSDLRQLSDLALHGLVHRLKQDTSNEDNTELLRQFLMSNVEYDTETALKLLAESGLEQLLMDFAMARGLVIDALEVLARQGQYTLATQTLEKLVKKGFAAHIAQVASGAFLQCIDVSSLIAIFCEKPQLVAQYPDLLLDNLSDLEIGALLQMAEVLDPSRPIVRGYLQRKINSRRRSSSLTSIASNWESLEATQRKDVRSQEASVMVYCFLMVVLHLNRRRHQDGTTIHLDFLFNNPAEFVQEAVENSQQSRRILACKASPLSAGQCHTAVVKGGELYTWGRLANSRLGHGEQKSNQTASGPCKVGTLKMLQIRVTSVACGLEHTLALTQQGVYGWGASKYGQVGMGTRHTYTRPMLVEGLSKVTCVALDCGQYHSLALTEEAQVYSWGWAIHGQLGHCDVEERLVPELVSYLQNQSIVKVAAGYCHTVFLNSLGELYICGSGYFGQLGLGTTTKQTIPMKVEGIPEKVITVATKYFHCLALTVRNKVYQWGSHPHGLRHFVQQQRRARQAGQTVFGQADEHLRPKLVDTSYVHGRIKQVVCGSLHSCIVTKNGDVYTWGKNLDGQLGNGTRQDIRIPQMVTHINDKQIVHLASGGEFNVAMDTNGQVWVWGRNEYGQLGVQSSDVQASGKIIKPSGMKTLSGPLTEATLPVPVNLQPGSPKAHGSFGDSLLERSLSYEDDDEEDYDTSVSLPNLDTLGTVQYDRLVISVMLECVPSVCDCNQLLRRTLDLGDWCVAAIINIHLQNYTEALAYHYMSLRDSKVSMEPDEFHASSIRVFNHYYGLVNQMENMAPHKEELMKTIVYQLLYHWEVENLQMSSLEECLERTLRDTALLLAAIIFSKGTTEEADPDKPTLFKPTLGFLASFSTKFCLGVTSTVLQKLQGDIYKTEPAGLSLLKQLGEDQFSHQSTDIIKRDKLPYDQLWQDIIQNLQKGLEARKYIYVTHNELDRLEEQLGDTDHSHKKRTPAVFFTCGHYYTQVAFNQEVEKFGRDLREGPLKLPDTGTVLIEYYKRKDGKPLACPRCVFSAITSM